MTHGAFPLDAKFIVWRAALLAGLVGGVVYLAMQFLWSTLVVGQGPWTWFRFTGAILLGRSVLAQESFDLPVFLVTLLVHFGLSIGYAVVLGMLLWRGGAGLAVLIGALFGAAAYALNYFVFTGWFPWFAELRHGVTLVNNIVFGVATVLAYRHFARARTARSA